jgi:hypothetical protein
VKTGVPVDRFKRSPAPLKQFQMLLNLLNRLEKHPLPQLWFAGGLKGAVGVGEALVVALAGGFVSNS